MLHRIKTSQLELGMYVASLEGSWLENPFWRSSFLLTKPEQIEALVSSYVAWVKIDDCKGKSPPKHEKPVSKVVSDDPEPSMDQDQPVDLPQSANLATNPAQPKRPIKPVNNDKNKREAIHTEQDNQARLFRVPAQEITHLSEREYTKEARRASSAIKRSRTAVMSLFEDARLGNAIKPKKLKPLIKDIDESVKVDPTIILNMSRRKTKEDYTYLHSVAVCALMMNFARKLRMPEAQIWDIGMAGLLHDVGKTAIPEDILMKPGKLGDKEWDLVHCHPQRGHEILSDTKGVSGVALDVCLGHHEKMDGTGYPRKVEADCLSLVTRMSSICDIYDAITSQRPYNKPLSASQALGQMQTWTGHFDKFIFRDFVNSLGLLPVGTLVQMNEDELGVVIGESAVNFSSPKVRIFYSTLIDSSIAHKDIDTARNKARQVMSVEDPLDWGFSDWPTMSASLLAGKAA